ncbi:hypothetical protein [Actinoplanes sichuanensis]|uniref:Uncharacterized protein n=1 Tax=Actinoplanes sichuanensis TaxID=512349 RepID=A0ABW4AND0_9ACTN|nr:hypothetical protein [Actinoplanes sichuanensis]
MSMSARLRLHAAHLDELRVRLGRVRAVVQRFEKDQTAFGALCGWVLTGLGERHLRHDELIAYVEETFVITVDGLRGVADGRQSLAQFVGEPDDGPRSATEIIDGVLATVESREWVEPLLAEEAPVAEFAIPLDDTEAAVRAGGLDVAMDRIPPLRRMVDDLAGMPEVVAEQARLWADMAGDLRVIGDDLRRCLDADFAGEDGPDVRAYLTLMGNNVEALRGLVATCTAMTVITKAAGDLILLARDIVRGLIGDLVARVSGWVADPAVVPLPVLVSRLGTMVAATWRIDAYLTALVTSIANLSRSIDG